MVTANNILFSPFCISRGSREGCPLSPLLFSLSLEPLAQSIRQHLFIEPITFCNTHHSLSLFADDILLYVNNAPSSIPHILDVFAQFSALSGYKINWSKSQLMTLNSSLDPASLPPHIPVVKSFKYLCVDIHCSLQSTSIKNFQNILKRMEEDLNRWSKLPNSLSARISIVKMDILPRVNFFSNMLPLPPPNGYWDKLNKVISKFVWDGKRPRLKWSTLQRRKSEGGLAALDVFLVVCVAPRVNTVWPQCASLMETNRREPCTSSSVTRPYILWVASQTCQASAWSNHVFLLSIWKFLKSLKWHTIALYLTTFILLQEEPLFNFRNGLQKVSMFCQIYVISEGWDCLMTCAPCIIFLETHFSQGSN